MKTVVVFYSLEGNTKYIAEILARHLQADLLELKTSRQYPSKGLGKYIWGGKSVILGETPELTNDSLDVSAYDCVVIGTPVWAGSYTPPVNTFLKRRGVQNKEVALFACHGGGGAKRCFAKLKEALPDNEMIGEIEFFDPLENEKGENGSRAAEWAEKLLKRQ